MYSFKHSSILIVLCLLRAPEFGHLLIEGIPSLLHLQTVDRQTAHWSPFVSVDAGEENGVWISFAAPPHYPWREMRLAVAQRRHEHNAFSILKVSFRLRFRLGMA